MSKDKEMQPLYFVGLFAQVAVLSMGAFPGWALSVYTFQV